MVDSSRRLRSRAKVISSSQKSKSPWRKLKIRLHSSNEILSNPDSSWLLCRRKLAMESRLGKRCEELLERARRLDFLALIPQACYRSARRYLPMYVEYAALRQQTSHFSIYLGRYNPIGPLRCYESEKQSCWLLETPYGLYSPGIFALINL